MPILLYNMVGSPPCHSVRLLAHTLGVELDIKELDYDKGDHLKPEFVEINPLHNVPTINDNGFIVNESRAILGYLVDKYAKDDSLYPKDPTQRTVINQRLYYDMGTLYLSFYQIFFGDDSKRERLEEAFQVLDKYLNGQEWVAGRSLSIADYAILLSVCSAETVGHDVSKYPNVAKWFKKAKETISGFEDTVVPGMTVLSEYYINMSKKS